MDGDGGRIAPDLTDVGSRRSAAFIESMIRDPQRTVPGTVMRKTPMTDQVLLLLVDYLRSPGGRSTLACRAKALRFRLLQHSGQVAEWSKARAWRAGGGTTKLETEVTLFYLDRTILPRL